MKKTRKKPAPKKSRVRAKKPAARKAAAKKPKKSGITIVKKAKVEKPVRKSRRKGKMNSVWVDVLLRDPRVRKWLVQAIGEHAIYVIQVFDRELSDEEIAKKSELRASDVRVVLNRLHAHGLATYSRSRDKNSGWYSYIWRLDERHASQLAAGIVKEEEEKPVQREEGQEMYYCEVDGKRIIYTFEQAAEFNFKCPQTGKPLKYLE